MSSRPTFRQARWTRTINLVLQAVLILALVGGLNYLAINHGWRFDLTRHRLHSLSPETLSYLRELKSPVKIVVTLTPDAEEDELAQAYRDVSNLLREYTEVAAAAGDNRVTVEYLDVYRHRRDAEVYGIDQPNVILVLSDGKRRVVGIDELYKVENREKRGFLGEQAFTAAILNVTRPGRTRVYTLQGHGEMELTDIDPVRGLSLLNDELKLRNFDVAPLDLSQARAIPDDAAAVLIAAPQGRCEPFEEEILRQYLANRAGRVIAFLAPGAPHGLDNLLFDWGLLADDVLVVDQGSEGQNDAGDLIIYPTNADHPVIRFLADNRIALRFGPSRQIRPDPGREIDNNLTVTPVLATSETAWGERSYRLRIAPRFDKGVDLPGRLAVGTLSERLTARGDLPFSIRGGRVAVFGGGDWVANARLSAGGNLSLVLSALNWLVDRDTQLTIPPRPVQRYQLTLSQSQLIRLRYSLLLILPGAAALLGLAVYWSRRR